MQGSLNPAGEVRDATRAQTSEAPRPKPTSSLFDRLLVEAVDVALADLLGDRTRNQIYDYLAAHYSYGREEIPERIDEFYTFLENTFAGGSRTVGRTIIRRLFDKLGYEYVNVPGFEFFDYLETVKARVARDAARQELAARTRSP